MPLPKPKKQESKNEFVSRCINHTTMKKEYPSKEQRLAICNVLYRD